MIWMVEYRDISKYWFWISNPLLNTYYVKEKVKETVYSWKIMDRGPKGRGPLFFRNGQFRGLSLTSNTATIDIYFSLNLCPLSIELSYCSGSTILHTSIEKNCSICIGTAYWYVLVLYTSCLLAHNSEYIRVFVVVTVILARTVYVDSVYHDTDNKTTHSHSNSYVLATLY
jgi:hypothetical protein